MEAVFFLNNRHLSTKLHDVSFWEPVVFAATAIKISCLTYLSDINLRVKVPSSCQQQYSFIFCSLCPSHCNLPTLTGQTLCIVCIIEWWHTVSISVIKCL